MHTPLKLWSRRAGLPLAALISACATTSPPRELTEAQQEFQKASTGRAAELNPAGLLQAKKALDRANQEYKEHPAAPSTRDFAYVALRRTQLAEVQADTLLAANQKAEAERQIQEARAEQQARAQRQAEQEARQAREQLAGSAQAQAAEPLRLEREKLARANEDLTEKNRQLQADRSRLLSDREGQEIRAKLGRVASVRQEPRGIVIAIPGGALFTSGRSTLLPSGKTRLDRVAEALAETDDKILIEGHTDARGSDRLNRGLSERRAITVRNYLAERGISPSRMTAAGLGGTRPLADNASPQGRASNRRLEIIVQADAVLSTG